jgi:hypothetical protein
VRGSGVHLVLGCACQRPVLWPGRVAGSFVSGRLQQLLCSCGSSGVFVQGRPGGFYSPIGRRCTVRRRLRVGAAVLFSGNAHLRMANRGILQVCLLQGGMHGRRRMGDRLGFGWNGKAHGPECSRVNARTCALLDSRGFVGSLNPHGRAFASSGNEEVMNTLKEKPSKDRWLYGSCH